MKILREMIGAKTLDLLAKTTIIFVQIKLIKIAHTVNFNEEWEREEKNHDSPEKIGLRRAWTANYELWTT